MRLNRILGVLVVFLAGVACGRTSLLPSSEDELGASNSASASVGASVSASVGASVSSAVASGVSASSSGAGGMSGVGGAGAGGAGAGGAGGSGDPCQRGSFWAKRVGALDSDYGIAVAAVPGGGVVVAGEYIGDVDIDGAPLPTAPIFSAFVTKLDASGNVLWSRGFPSEHGCEPTAIAVGLSGEIVVVGEFRGTLDFGGGPLTNLDDGLPDPFVLKLSASGDHVWSRSFPGDEADVANAVAVGAAGEIVIGGYYGLGNGGGINFGAGKVFTLGSSAAFLVKLSSFGDLLFAKSYGQTNTSTDLISGLALDAAGNIFITGESEGLITFGGAFLPQLGDGDAFLVKLNSSGGHLWSLGLGGSGSDGGRAVAATPGGGAAITGYFNKTIDLGGGALTANSQADVFVGVFNAFGAHVWSAAFGSKGHDEGYAIAVDALDRVIVAGSCAGDINFGGGPIGGQGSADAFVAAFDAGGASIKAELYGSDAYDATSSVAIGPANSVFLAGSFSKTVAFGGCPLTSAGETDAFIERLGL